MRRRGSRRDQILAGGAVPPERSSQGADRRSSPRQLPPVGFGRPVVGAFVATTKDVSAGGVAVVATLALDVGDSVPLKFAGQPVVGARIAWKRGALVGLAVGTAAG